MRRHAVLLAAAVALATGSAGAQDQLVISTWGFNGDLLEEHLYQPFEQKHNVDIVLETGNNADRLNKVRLRGGSEVDLIYLADAFTQDAINAGLLAEIDRSKLSHVDALHDIAKAPHGEDYGPAYTIGRFGIIYDADAASEPVTSWDALWRDEFAGRVAIPNISTTAGPLMVVIAGERAGTSAYEDPEPAFAELAELAPNLLKTYGRSSELANMFAQGEVVIAAAQDFVFSRIKDAVPSARWAELEDGAYANLNTINVVEGSDNALLAHAFIDWALSAEAQKALAVAKVDAPVNTNVELTPEEAAPWTYGDDVIASLNEPDWAAIVAARDDWTERWNATFRE